MAEPHLRHNVRALIVGGEERRLLLMRFGVGLDLADAAAPVHVWSERVVSESHATGYDGVVNDFFLVEVPDCFQPRGSLSAEELREENIREHRWWSPSDLLTAPSRAVFGPRRLPSLFADLLRSVPATPVCV